MARLSLPFHASRDEIAQLVAGWVTDRGLWMAFETWTPAYRAELVAEGGLEGPLQLPPEVRRIVLGIRPLTMERRPPYALGATNPDSLSIDLGPETPGRLGISELSASTDDQEALQTWRKIRKQLVAGMIRGAMVTNTATDASGVYSDHYFSPGARELSARGTELGGPTDLLVYQPA
ncbi:hypothetical protein AB0F72_18970 [Actinoplanes sp. NPDC023936]|uniref:hypothetical protein n=1 Tax=Actinoplanes sp. NPDC023936 TaxID=3154910 RepID=UPI0033DC11D8